MQQVKRAAAACLILLLAAQFGLGHEGKPHGFEDLLRTWSFDPLIVGSLVLMAAVYILGLVRLWQATGWAKAINGWEAAAFGAGWLSLVVALVSPLHPWGEVLFSAHMTQHEILMLIAAPLLVLSRPLIATLWAMPVAWRGSSRSLIKNRTVSSIWHFITLPFAAFIIHAIALWMWHIPFLFQATLQSDLVHTLQHTSFFGSALLFWWAIMGSPRGAAGYGAGVLYLFATSVHSGVLGAFLTFTTTILYPTNISTTGSWGLSPLEDQQLGGLIMWVPAGIVYIVAGLLMLAGWLRESEKRVLKREQELWAGADR